MAFSYYFTAMKNGVAGDYAISCVNTLKQCQSLFSEFSAYVGDIYEATRTASYEYLQGVCSSSTPQPVEYDSNPSEFYYTLHQASNSSSLLNPIVEEGFLHVSSSYYCPITIDEENIIKYTVLAFLITIVVAISAWLLCHRASPYFGGIYKPLNGRHPEDCPDSPSDSPQKGAASV